MGDQTRIRAWETLEPKDSQNKDKNMIFTHWGQSIKFVNCSREVVKMNFPETLGWNEESGTHKP